MIKIDGKRIDDPGRAYVIAEASGNHHKDMMAARALVVEAVGAGADAVKFQTFEPDEIAAEGITIPRGIDERHDAWIDYHDVKELRDLFAIGGLPRAWHRELKSLTEGLGITFLSTPFSVDAARFLVEEIRVSALKISSGDITFEPLLNYAKTLRIPIILSTGGATRSEIDRAIYLLFSHDLELALMHCRSSYPCSTGMMNLRCISTLRRIKEDNWPSISSHNFTVGLSDHTTSLDVPAYAVCAGATIIEKHLKLYGAPAIDGEHSLYPGEFKTMVDNIRYVEKMLGDGDKKPIDAEMHDRLWARRDPSDWLRPTKEAREGRWE